MKTAFQMVLGIVVVWAIVFATGCQKESNLSATPAVQVEKKLPPSQTPPASQSPVQPSKPPQAVKQPAKSIEKAPSIKIEKSEHDFGTIGPGTFNECQFKFSNIGKGELKIDSIQSSCGCAVPELTKKEYAPGESGVIDVTFHAPGYAGLTTKHLYVISNDPVIPRAELAIKAVVEVKVVVDPNRLELAINKENGGMIPLKVKSIDNVPFAITSFSATGQSITLEFDPKEKRVEHVLNPKVNMSKIQEINAGIIQIGIDHPQAKEVVVSYSVQPMFELRPSRIILQNAEPGSVTKREVWVVNNYGQSFEIESITSRNGYMKVINQKKEGHNIGLDIEITPPSQQGLMRRYIADELSVKIKNGPSLTIRCSGWLRLG
jgi:hypothetical protein